MSKEKLPRLELEEGLVVDEGSINGNSFVDIHIYNSGEHSFSSTILQVEDVKKLNDWLTEWLAAQK